MSEIEISDEQKRVVRVTTFFLKISVPIFLIVIVGFTWALFTGQQERSQRIDALKVSGHKSTVHQFVVDKYLSCERESILSSKDECVSRVMVLARVQGVEYETLVAAAVRDLGLDK